LRVEKFREVWRLIQDTPIFGLGSSKFLITTTDNLYTRVLLDTGFLGLALYFLLTGYVFYLGYRVHRHFPPGWQSVLGLSVMAFLVAVYVGNMGARVLSFPRVDELFWLLVGSVVAILPSAQATPAPSLRGGGFEG
jgi:O-antigen ligase